MLLAARTPPLDGPHQRIIEEDRALGPRPDIAARTAGSRRGERQQRRALEAGQIRSPEGKGRVLIAPESQAMYSRNSGRGWADGRRPATSSP